MVTVSVLDLDLEKDVEEADKSSTTDIDTKVLQKDQDHDIRVNVVETTVEFDLNSPKKPEQPRETKLPLIVRVGRPDAIGQIKIGFNRNVLIPSNYTDWTSEDGGNQRLKIKFFPTEETIEAA